MQDVLRPDEGAGRARSAAERGQRRCQPCDDRPAGTGRRTATATPAATTPAATPTTGAQPDRPADRQTRT
ncbi:hypothetical protein EJ357_38105 [Streptomyces cyaneochromogenes]|uniref:Uncharacterized protein n=1 Tax=Streptomyces cyaneochromogenes TaxID=2496836 RepID=A0A3Q9ET77_9ACTN|nr:hypothetical protein EJ357_38105 [Streptomyces cyaneochromogenes]